MRSGRMLLIPVAVSGALFAAACASDDDADPTTAPTATEAPTEAPTADATEPATETPDANGDGEPAELVSGEIEVGGFDYGFSNLPSRIAVGSTITFVNESATELHELVAIRLPEGEERSAEELLALTPEEQEALMEAGPAMVLVAAPGEEQIAFVGTGEVTEAGRYLVLCAIPAGANVAEWLAAAEADPSGPPEVAGGPPHLVFGMYGEFTAEAAE